MRRSQTLAHALQTTFDRAWAFISDPENLHLWTVGFAQGPPTRATESGLYHVQTPRGSIDLFVKCDRETGVIDFYFGRNGSYRCSPSRLVRQEDGVLYVFTQFEPDNAPPGLFEQLVENVKKEFELLDKHLALSPS